MTSVLILWPDSFDFPIFRSKLFLLQMYVDEVIICFTQHGNHPLREWLTQNIHGVKFLNAEDAPEYGGDWRNKATNYMIDASTGDVIFFLEQDFLIQSYQDFFASIKKSLNLFDVVMFKDTNRFHPACLFVKRSALLRTDRNFSAGEQGMDHFSSFTQDLEKSANIISLPDTGLKESRDWLHLQGVTDNCFAPKPYFDVTNFYTYTLACKKVEPMSEYWNKEMERMIDMLPIPSTSSRAELFL